MSQFILCESSCLREWRKFINFHLSAVATFSFPIVSHKLPSTSAIRIIKAQYMPESAGLSILVIRLTFEWFVLLFLIGVQTSLASRLITQVVRLKGNGDYGCDIYLIHPYSMLCAITHLGFVQMVNWSLQTGEAHGFFKT